MRSPLHGQSNQVRSQSQHYLKGSATDLGTVYVLESPPCWPIFRPGACAGYCTDKAAGRTDRQREQPGVWYGQRPASPQEQCSCPPSLCRWSHR